MTDTPTIVDVPAIVDEVAKRLEPLGIECYFGRDRQGDRTRGTPKPTIKVTSIETGDDFDTDVTGAPNVAAYVSTGPTGIVRWEGVEVKITARASSAADGKAEEIASKRVVRAVVDSFLVEWDKVQETFRADWRNLTGGFEPLDDGATKEIGARYQLLFQVATAIDAPRARQAAAGLTVGHGLVVRDGAGNQESAC